MSDPNAIPRQQPESAETEAAIPEWLDHWTAGPTRERWSELPPQRGDLAPSVGLIDARSGGTMELSPMARTRRRSDGARHRRDRWIQARGGDVCEIRPGDTIHTPPGEWHCHGAAPDRFMTHLAMWEAPAEGPESEWGALVSEDEYLAAPGERSR